MTTLLFFLFLAAAVWAGVWASKKFGKPCGCKDAEGAAPAKV